MFASVLAMSSVPPTQWDVTVRLPVMTEKGA